MTIDDATERLQSLIDRIENEVPDRAKDVAPDFFDSVSDGARDMLDTLEHMDDVTDRQASAIEGWERGVEKWIR